MNDNVIHIRLRNAAPLTVGDKIFKSAYDWELTEKDLEKAARELGETEEKKKICLKKLKEKLLNDSDVKYRLDDFYLLRFLRVRKYDVKKAYQNVKIFYELRRNRKDFYTISPNFKSLVELNWVTCLPYTDEEGIIFFWIDLKKWGPESSFEILMPTITAVCDIAAMNPRVQINGGIGIWDLEGLTLRHVSQLLWNGLLWSGIKLAQNGYPWRIKKVIIVNVNRFVGFLYNMARPLLQKKIAERVILLGSDLDELHQHVNPVLLPKALKGSLEENDCDISQYILDNLPYLKYERSFIFD